MTKLSHTLALCAVAALSTACGSVPKRTFVFDAIDTGEDPRPAMIVVDQDWLAAGQNKQFINLNSNDELTLDLEFKSRDIEIMAVAIRTLDGTPVSVPTNPRDAAEISEYELDSRKLRAKDAERQLFIFQRK
ncbi:MAG: hypothetical protein AB8H80_08145 [Planctomycetota bacterium]